MRFKQLRKRSDCIWGVCDAVSSPRPFNVSCVTIKVSVLLESFDLVARYDTSHCSTDRFFFFAFFFLTQKMMQKWKERFRKL